MNTTIPQAEQDAQVKRRAACDECRGKKLKCTGEHPACSRCVRENITCVYSPQKQMGRPKKRQRTDEDAEAEQMAGSGNSMDLGMYEHRASEGDRPWLLPDNSWDWDIQNLGLPVPGLTPDASSNDSITPPTTLNLPPELSHSHQRPDASTSLLLSQPSLGCPPTTLPNCACLSTLYLTLTNLQQMPAAFPFPFALHPLREAMATASEILACEQCPKSFISSVQNTQLVGTLLTSIAERFARVLESINAEAERAETARESKKFRLADLNTSTSHLHTGGLGCAAAFSIDLSPAEWRSMAKKVVRAEVHGPSEGNACCPYFLGVTRQMAERQERWHGEGHAMPKDCPQGVPVGRQLPREEHVCFKLVGFAERMVGGFDWS